MDCSFEFEFVYFIIYQIIIAPAEANMVDFRVRVSLEVLGFTAADLEVLGSSAAKLEVLGSSAAKLEVLGSSAAELKVADLRSRVRALTLSSMAISMPFCGLWDQ